jgi:predicted thioesterase
LINQRSRLDAGNLTQRDARGKSAARALTSGNPIPRTALRALRQPALWQVGNARWTQEHRRAPVTAAATASTTQLRSMNHQGVSEIFFEESYTVPADQTAKSLFARLPHGSEYAERLIECLATGYLVAVIESICIREMQQHVDAAAEVVVGRSIRIDHLGPIPPGSPLRLRGWLERLGDRSATFRVQAQDAHEIVCGATVTLVAAPRAQMDSRIATKVLALQCPGD